MFSTALNEVQIIYYRCVILQGPVGVLFLLYEADSTIIIMKTVILRGGVTLLRKQKWKLGRPLALFPSSNEMLYRQNSLFNIVNRTLIGYITIYQTK